MATVMERDADKDERIAELEREVAALKERIRQNGAVNRAKGWLADCLDMTEQESYRTVQLLASHTNSRLHEAAASVNLLIECVEKVERERAERGR